MTVKSAFKSAEGASEFLAAYDEAMGMWPVPHEDVEVPTRFGLTHVVVSGPTNGPALVLLHGFMATLTMWALNIGDLSDVYRVYAVDTMGQPNKSVPDEPLGSRSDVVEWLSGVLDGLDLNRMALAGMSFGAWMAFNLALDAPHRVERLVLLSPAASLQPLVKQFGVRGMLAGLLRTRRTAASLLGWMGFEETTEGGLNTHLVDLMWLGMKHYQMPPEARQLIPEAFSDSELRSLSMPVLLLMGDREVIYDPAKALKRAQQLIPDVEAELIPHVSHDMTVSRANVVNQRILQFLGDF